MKDVIQLFNVKLGNVKHLTHDFSKRKTESNITMKRIMAIFSPTTTVIDYHQKVIYYNDEPLKFTVMLFIENSYA